MFSEIARANIRRFQELLKADCTEAQRGTLNRLLAEEETKLLEAEAKRD